MLKEQESQFRRKRFELQVNKLTSCCPLAQQLKSQNLGLLICKMGIEKLLPSRAAVTIEHGNMYRKHTFQYLCFVSAQ